MFNQIKIVNFLCHTKIESSLKERNLIVSESALGKTSFFTALFFLSAGTDIRNYFRSPLIQNGQNYATVEVVFVNVKNINVSYKVLIQPHKTTFFRNDQPINISVLINEIPLFVTNLSELFFYDKTMQYQWLKHKISKIHPPFWAIYEKTLAQIQQLKKIAAKPQKSVLDEQKQNEITMWIWRTSQTWQNHTAQFLQVINKNLTKVVRSFSAHFAIFQLSFQPFRFGLKGNQTPPSSSLTEMVQQSLLTKPPEQNFWFLFFGGGFQLVGLPHNRSWLSSREQLNQQLFIEIVAAMWFYVQTKLKPILMIDNFDQLHPETQQFIWRFAHNFAQIFISALSLDTIDNYKILPVEKTQIIKIIKNETQTPN